MHPVRLPRRAAARLLTAAATAALLVGAVPGLQSAAQAQAAQLVPAQSQIGFTSKQMGVPVDGSFKRFDAKLSFDPKHPEAATVTLNVDLTSASLGAAEVEAELVKPAWFDTKKQPTATFQSTAVKAGGPGKLDVAGTLSIKGSSQPVTVPVTLTQSGGTTTAQGTFTIKRLAWKIGDGDWSDTSMVADDVQVKFKLALTGVPPL